LGSVLTESCGALSLSSVFSLGKIEAERDKALAVALSDSCKFSVFLVIFNAALISVIAMFNFSASEAVALEASSETYRKHRHQQQVQQLEIVVESFHLLG
jgi:hypothetical protein